MKPQLPRRLESGRQSAAFACSLFLWALGAVAAPAAEPALRLSVDLSRPAAAASEGERDLLRIEYKAAQSSAAEADLVGSMLARVRRMDAMVADIRRLIDVWPVAAPGPATPKAAASAPATGRQPDAPNSGLTVDITPTNLYSLVALAAALTFLAWMLKERNDFNRRKRRAQAANPVATNSSLAFDQPTVTAAVPGAAAVAVAVVAPPQPPAPPAPPPPPVAAAPEPVATPALPPAGESRPDISMPLDFELITEREAPAPIPTARPDAGALPDIAESLELADIMLSMGLAHGAAETLSEQIRQNPKRALFHWLKLLEIYRHSDMREDFERAATDLRKVFNVQAQPWQATGGEISLEDYPHLAAQVQALWPTPACGELLANLLDDNRGGTRNGFPQSVAEEILLLRQIVDAHAVAGGASAQTGLSIST